MTAQDEEEDGEEAGPSGEAGGSAGRARDGARGSGGPGRGSNRRVSALPSGKPDKKRKVSCYVCSDDLKCNFITHMHIAPVYVGP